MSGRCVKEWKKMLDTKTEINSDFKVLYTTETSGFSFGANGKTARKKLTMGLCFYTW